MSASIRSVSEDDFDALAWAANEAAKQGDRTRAQRLDVMARKANASLAFAKYAALAAFCPRPTRLRWMEVPSTLISITGGHQ